MPSGRSFRKWVAREGALLAILLAAALLRFFRLDERCLFGDAVLTVEIISQADPAAVWNTVTGGFPADLPLYYVILYFWRALGTSVFWLRSLSVFSGLLVVIVAYRLVKDLFGRQAALLTAFLLAISPFRVLLNQTVRYYSLNSFINLLALYLLHRAMRDPAVNRKWISYALVRAVSLYINYSSFLLFFAEALYVFYFRARDRRIGRKWLVCFAAVIILWLPVCGYMFRDFSQLATGEGFSRTPLRMLGAANILYFLFVYSVGKTITPFNYPLIAVIAAFFGFLVFRFARRAARGELPRERVAFCLLMLLVPTVFCALSAYNSPRYVMASSVMYAVILALGLLSLPLRARLLALLFIVIVRGYSLYNLYAERNYVKMEFVDHWDDIVSFVKGNSGVDSLIVFDSHAFEYYLGLTAHEAAVSGLPESGEEGMAEFVAGYFEGRDVRRVVLVSSPLSGTNYVESAAQWKALRKWLRSRGYRLTKARAFDRDPFAAEKRKVVRRHFPEYRTTVSIFTLPL